MSHICGDTMRNWLIKSLCFLLTFRLLSHIFHLHVANETSKDTIGHAPIGFSLLLGHFQKCLHSHYALQVSSQRVNSTLWALPKRSQRELSCIFLRMHWHMHGHFRHIPLEVLYLCWCKFKTSTKLQKICKAASDRFFSNVMLLYRTMPVLHKIKLVLQSFLKCRHRRICL